MLLEACERNVQWSSTLSTLPILKKEGFTCIAELKVTTFLLDLSHLHRSIIILVTSVSIQTLSKVFVASSFSRSKLFPFEGINKEVQNISLFRKGYFVESILQVLGFRFHVRIKLSFSWHKTFLFAHLHVGCHFVLVRLGPHYIWEI